jgi:uncharacterized repeat protein (TIGR02543 family)/uncharacterized delta-60 repeat protein
MAWAPNSGIVTVNFSPGSSENAEVRDIAIDSIGRVYVVGTLWEQTGSSVNTSAFILRITESGIVDTTFGIGGKVIWMPSASFNARATSISIDSGDRVFITGQRNSSSTSSEAFIARFGSTGALDSNFASDGILLIPSSSNHDSLTGSIIDNRGDLVVIGRWDASFDSSGWQTSGQYLMARMTTDGALDSSFDSDGILVTTRDGLPGVWNTIETDSNNNYMITGKAYKTFSSSESDTIFDKFSDVGATLFNRNLDTGWDEEGRFIAPGVNGTTYLGSYSSTGIPGQGCCEQSSVLIQLNADGIQDNSFVFGETSNNRFSGYLGDAAVVDGGIVTLVASYGWSLSKYLISSIYALEYSYNSATGGDLVSTATYTAGDTPITLPTPTRTGYTFAGWYSDEALTSKIGDAGESYSPTGTLLSLNAYAKWTANTYFVIYNYNSTTDGSYPSGADFTTGDNAIRLFTPVRRGYTFAGWYSDEALTSKIGDAGESYSPSGSTLVLNAFAKWIANTYELPADGNYGCNTGIITEALNSYQIIDGVVSQGSGCVGGLVFPEGVIAIGENAFDRFSTGVTSVIIPASVKQIESRAFSGASNLQSVIFEPGSELESIGYAAFSGGSLVSIEIPSSVLSIGELAFSYQSELTNLTFGANSKLESIGDQAFTYNVSISSVNIPASVKSIGWYSFHHADALERVTFAAGSELEMIDGGAFADTLSLTSITIPSGVTHIGDSAFYGSGIRSAITIPANCIYIGEYAFAYARNLEAVNFEPGSKLTEINFKTFEGTDSLLRITIPASIEEISSYAFYLSSGLRLVHFEGNAPIRVGTRAFSEIGYDPKAVTTNDAAGFGTTGELWNGLKVAKVHAVIYNSNGGSVVNASSFVSFEEIEMAPIAPTRVGYTFTGWSLTSSGAVVDFPFVSTSSRDITFYARWTKNPVKAIATAKPTVTGTAKTSKTLTARKGTWTGYPTPSISYQWYACSGSLSTPRSTVPTSCKEITGATKSTFKIARAQKGKFISVLVTGSSAGTTKTTWLSKSTSKVS